MKEVVDLEMENVVGLRISPTDFSGLYQQLKEVPSVIGGNVRLLVDLGCIDHCRFLKLELDGIDVETELDVFIIRTYRANLSNFRIRTF